MSFPMHLTSKRRVECGCTSRDELLDRIDFWADRYGFRWTADEADDIVYTRGSHWHALYTFDIRKVPTEVRIRLLHEFGPCVCTMVCGSWFQFSSPGDEKRLSEQMDLLVACLKGALTDRPTPAEPRIVQDRDRNRRSQDIQERQDRAP